MKKLKYILTAVFIAAVFLGLWYKSMDERRTYKETEFLFDTKCSVIAYGSGAETAVKEAFDVIEEIHSLTNFYSDTSDVAKINSAKPGECLKINTITAEILKTALEISEKTKGSFDPTIAPLSELWSAGRENPTVPDEGEIKAAAGMVDYTALELDPGACIIRKKADVKVDLGAAAKGYACDKAVEIFKKKNLSAIIDLGGNVSCTGKNPKTADGSWRIGLQVPFEATGTYEEVVEISSGSVVTSGTYQRYFEENGKKYHHIIDPETGYPKKADYNAVTIVADSSLLADCLSTACFVLGREKGKNLADEYKVKIYFY